MQDKYILQIPDYIFHKNKKGKFTTNRKQSSS